MLIQLLFVISDTIALGLLTGQLGSAQLGMICFVFIICSTIYFILWGEAIPKIVAYQDFSIP